MTPPPLKPWADLHADYFLPIVDRVPSLRDYVYVRAVCTAWRSALPPVRQSPSLLVLHDFQPHDGPPRDNSHVYALSIRRQQRTFRLATLPCHSSRIIGSSNGYLTIADGCHLGALNPVTGEQIELVALPNNLWPRRVMLGPNPRPGCYTAVAICDHNYVTQVAYMTIGGTDWRIADVVAVDRAKLVDLFYDAERGDIYCLDERGDVQVHHISPRGGRTKHLILAKRVVGAVGPCSDCPSAFAPPYDIMAKKIYFKRIFLCEGALYQVWQNTTSTINLQLPAGGVFTMPSDEMLVLGYYPERRPCWETVKDLGGYSVFICKNNAMVLKAEDTPGVRPNCVYWIDCRLRPWVFDMSTKASTLCVLPHSVGRPMCWYFNRD